MSRHDISALYFSTLFIVHAAVLLAIAAD